MEKSYLTIVCTNGDYDDLPKIVEFDIDETTAREIVKLSALVKANGLVAVQKRDRRARYYQYDPVENPEQAQEAGEDNEVRTSADCLNVNEEDFWFSAYLKHADIELLSERRCTAQLIGCLGISAETAGSAGDDQARLIAERRNLLSQRNEACAFVDQVAGLRIWSHDKDDGSPYAEGEKPSWGFIDSHDCLMNLIEQARGIQPGKSDSAGLEGYDNNATVADLYGIHPAFSEAINRLIPGFEYPDWSHRTIADIKRRLRLA
jgi:hypothetical protein